VHEIHRALLQAGGGFGRALRDELQLARLVRVTNPLIQATPLRACDWTA